MVAGWGLPLAGLAVGQLLTSGRTADIGAMALWTGVFALVSWVVVVLPVMLRFGQRGLFSALRYSWLGWGVLGMVVFGMLAIPLMGWAALIIIWYPGIIGGISGVAFALLRRRAAQSRTG